MASEYLEGLLGGGARAAAAGIFPVPASSAPKAGAAEGAMRAQMGVWTPGEEDQMARGFKQPGVDGQSLDDAIADARRRGNQTAVAALEDLQGAPNPFRRVSDRTDIPPAQVAAAGDPGQTPLKWSQVVQKPDFQRLSTDQQEAARSQYFADVVAPQVPTDQLVTVRQQFDADTKPTLGKRIAGFATATRDAVSEEIGDAVDLAKTPKGLSQRQLDRAAALSKLEVARQTNGASAAELAQRAASDEALRRGGLQPEDAVVAARSRNRSATEAIDDTLKGGAQGALSVARGATYLTNRAVKAVTGSESDTLREAQQTMGGVSDILQGQKSAPLRQQAFEVDKAHGFVGTVATMSQNPATLWDGIAQSLPSMLPGMALGRAGGVGAVALKVGERAAGTAATAGAIGGEALTSAGTTGANVQDFVRQVPFADLQAHSAGYRDAIAAGLSPDEARNHLAEVLSSDAALKAGLATAFIAAVSGAGEITGRAATGHYAEHGVGGFIKTTAKEAIQEGLQNPAEDYSAYQAQRQVDPNQTFDPGKSAAQGMVSAAGQAAGVHALGVATRASTAARAAQTAPADTGPLNASEILGHTGQAPGATPGQAPLALPERPAVMPAGAGGGTLDQAVAEQAAVDRANQVYAQRDAEEERRAAAMEAATAPPAPAPAPAPKAGDIRELIADPKQIFDAAVARPKLFDLVQQAIKNVPEYVSSPAEDKAALDTAVKALEADPRQIFDLAKAQPDVYRLIAQAIGDVPQGIVAPAHSAAPTATSDTSGPAPATAALPREAAAHIAGDVVRVTGQPFGSVDSALRARKFGRAPAGWQAVPVQGGYALRAPLASTAAAPTAETTARPSESTVDVAAHEAATSPQSAAPAPTEAQREAGNFRMGHTSIDGLDITIEHPEGSRRRPEWAPLPAHYGYFKGTVGADKDHVDVFVRPGTPEDFSGDVFVVNQVKPKGGFDEAKVMLGYQDEAAARRAYTAAYPKGWQGLGSVATMGMEQFKTWLADGDKSKVAVTSRRDERAGDARRSDGRPFGSIESAERARKARALPADLEVKQIQDGFVLRKPEAKGTPPSVKSTPAAPGNVHSREEERLSKHGQDENERFFDGRAGRGLPLSLAKEYQQRLTREERDFDWHVVEAPEHGHKMWKVVGRLRAPQASRSAARPADNISDYTFATGTTSEGLPVYGNKVIGLGKPRVQFALGLPGGARRIAFDIFDRTIKNERGHAMAAGKLLVDVGADGRFLSLRNIEVASKLRQQGLGYGEKVVASLLQHNQTGLMEIWDIQHAGHEGTEWDALPFWRRMGTTITHFSSDPDVPMEGALSLNAYLRARRTGGNVNDHETGKAARGTQEPAQPAAGAAPATGESDIRGSDGNGPGGGRVRGNSEQEGEVAAPAASSPDQGAPIRQALEKAFGGEGIKRLEVSGLLWIGPSSEAPADIKDAMAGEPWKAGYFRSRGYIFTDHSSPSEAPGLLLHELGVHHDLRQILPGEAYQKVLRSVKTLSVIGNPTIKAAWAHVTRLYPDLAPGSDHFVEEVIARVAEGTAVQRMAWWKQLLDGARAWLLRQGLKNVSSEADLRTLVQASLRHAIATAGSPVEISGNPSDHGSPADLAPAAARSDTGKSPVYDEQARRGGVFSNGILDALFKHAGGELAARLITRPIYDRVVGLGQYIPETVKQGLVSDYGLSEPYVEARTDRDIAVSKALREGKNLLEKVAGWTPAEQRIGYLWMQEKPDTALEKTLIDRLPKESQEVLRGMKEMIDGLGKEAVKLGLLSKESYERNQMSYLRRSYLKHEAETAGADGARWKAAAVIRGDSFKGRGLRDDVSATALSKRTGPIEKGDRFVRLELRDQGVDGQPGTLRQKVYVPEKEPVPAKYSTWRRDGVWEARFFDKKDEIGLWRDMNEQERQRLGEIEEVGYAFAKTILSAVRDIENARFLHWAGETEGKATADDVEQAGGKVVDAANGLGRGLQVFAANEWVKVPESPIPGTKLRKYGALAGKFVPGPVWNDVRQQVEFRAESQLGRLWDNALKAWKVSKTALSPAVHTNNIASNFIMADAADVRFSDLASALRTIIAARRGDAQAKTWVERYQDSGAELGSFAAADIRTDFIEPLLKDLSQPQNETVAQLGLLQLISLAAHKRPGLAAEALMAKRPMQLAKLPFTAMIAAYRSEDSVFRLAKFMKEAKAGSADKLAGKAAREAFLDYNINAPWIRALRRGPLPFLAFSYRAIPMLIRTAAQKPWKLAKYAAVFSALNWMAYAMLGSGGNEDRERKLLPDEKSGKMFGAIPRLLRMPWNDAHGSPVFLDIRRFVPGGDMFDITGSKGAVPLPQWLSVGGPLALMAELATNRDSFTGKDITLQTDTSAEAAEKVTDHLFKFIAPNVPLPNPIGWAVDKDSTVPGLWQTYSWTAISNANKGKTDAFGREQDLKQAALSSVGVKVGSYPADAARMNAMSDYDRQDKELEQQTSSLERQLSMKGISREEFDRKQAVITSKRQALADKLRERIGR